MSIQTKTLLQGFEAAIAAAPEAADRPRTWLPPVAPPITPPGGEIAFKSGLGKRYRPKWDRPADPEWQDKFARVLARVQAGGLVVLLGKRGTGKTRIAAEVMRDVAPDGGRYVSAMALFLRLRAAMRDKSAETERDIVAEIAKARLLVLDEVQERGETAWEDRILAHVLDLRYSAELPSILIGNLTPAAFQESAGASIVSRMNETGGVIEFAGKSWRD